MRVLLSLILILPLVGCATRYQDISLRSWNLMRDKKVDEALSLYEKNVTDKGDELLRLMDEGMILRVGGRYQESNQKLLKAAKIIDQSDYLSLGEQSLSLVTNETQTTYQGEDFEKVLIHLYLSLNFMELGEWDSALVEARRVNEILYQFISKAKRPYELNAFARYLGGSLFEHDRDFNNAWVSYKGTAKIDPSLLESFQALTFDIIRMTKEYGTGEDLDQLKQKDGQKIYDEALKTLQQKMSAVVLLFECGKSPQKYSSRESRQASAGEILVPVSYYQRRFYSIAKAEIEMDGKKVKSAVLNDIQATAVQHLKDRMGRTIAKALLSAGIKAGIATGVGIATKSKELGLLTGFALMMASEADTRSWLLLPAQLQVAKVFAPAGNYPATIRYLNNYDTVQETEKVSLNLKPGKIVFLQRRKFD